MAITFINLTIFVFLAVLVVVLLRCLRDFLRKPGTRRSTQLRTHVPSSVSSEADESRGRSLWKYDVFLSFRGKDSRRSFVSHLYEALTKEGIKAFHDDRELMRGDFIWDGLVKAIDESRFAIVVLSKGYATSRWCLEELSLIVDLASKKRLELIPIFLDIDPSELKRRSGCFHEALEKHELRYDVETVGRWRRALAEVGNISGWDSMSRNEEAVLVQEVVGDLSNRLFSQSSSDTEGLVGIMSHMRSIESLLSMDSDSGDVRMVGIWGMGGIGKSTIAKFVCNRLSSKFDGVCFLENAKMEFEQYGSSHMRQKVLREILRRNLNSWDGDSGVMRQRLRGKSILLVIDNVDNVEQLQELVGSLEWFGPGSRIVITTRDKRVLEQHDVEYIYEVRPLSITQALKLFSKHAFKQPRPPKDTAELSIDIVKQLDGLPLAIRVAGASLYRRDITDWEYYLDLLRTNVNSSVSKALRESFEALNNQEKLIFLYVACCFNGKHKHRVSRVLDLFIVSGHRPFRSTLCIRTLSEKCLISISTTKRLWVHDSLQDMARSIICEGKEENPWKRKMLWNFMDINNVLCGNMGSEAVEVESLLLDMPKGKELCISPAIFERMYNLKLLKFYNNSTGGESKICMPDGLVYLPMLRYLHWQAYTLKSLPSRFCTTYLVELNLPNSSVETLWNGTQDLGNLRRMNLRGCSRLLEVPNLSKATSLEKLTLDNCESLVDLTDSVRHLNNLGVLELSGCKKLKNLPSNINLRLLRTLHLEGCSSLEDFPFLSENVEKISLDETAIEEIPASIERLSELKTLHLSGCKKLKNLPRTIGNIDSLTTLWLSNCPNITLFPEVGDNIESLALKGTAIEEVPATIGDKSRLSYLNMSGCQRLKNLPLTLRNLTHLKFLFLRGCTNITERPETAGRLKALDLNGTSIMETPRSVQSDDDEPLDMPSLAKYILQSIKERIRHQRSMKL